MRIAFIGQKGIPARSGGVEHHVEALATHLARHGHAVTVYVRKSYTDVHPAIWRNVRLIYLPALRTKHLETITFTLYATLHALFQPYDVIHYQSIGPGSLAWIIRIFRRRTALIATFHCKDYEHSKWGTLARAYLRFGEYISCTVPHKTVVVSRDLERYVLNRWKRTAAYIPNGALVSPTHSAASLQRRGLKPERYILAVSRLVPHKGIHHLITAFARIAGRFPDISLVIVGDGSYTDGYVHELRELARAHARIRFLGEQRDLALAELFTHARFFIHPSSSEGLSIALLEAMGYGLAVLASDIPGNREALADTGLLFRAGDTGDLEQKLVWLLEHPGEAHLAARRAQVRVREHFDWNTITLKTLALYTETVAQRLPAALKLAAPPH
ncbi:MAG: glycosyltransferase family 4 protein [bacterium]|nr:glycosyltransferase family 4 protein [bacterium]